MEKPLDLNPTKVATKWAIINTVTGIVLTYAFEFMNLDQSSPLKYLTYVPFIAFMFLAQKEFKDQQGGFITYGTAFSTGFRYALFTGLLTALFIYLYFSFLSPEVFEKTLEASRAIMEEKNMSDAEIDKAMGITHTWGPLFGAFGVAIGSAVLGAVISLITAAIVKKERSPFDIVDDATDPTV